MPISMLPLTPKQKDILDFMKEYIAEQGYAPSYAEIAKHFTLSSRASIAQYLATLQKKGHLLKNGTARGVALLKENKTPKAIELTLAGLITAGSPIEAVETNERMEVPSELVRDPSNAYVLKVKGNSMIEDGILSGDYVIVEKNPNPKNGDVVVALLENTYATLKRFYREANRIKLQPANSTMAPIYCKDVAIQGVVRALIRKFTF